jgi:hypothetical protein
MPVAKLWEDIREHSCMVGGCRDRETRAISANLDLKTLEARISEIKTRPWTPEECPCTCVSGELYALAQKGS